MSDPQTLQVIRVSNVADVLPLRWAVDFRQPLAFFRQKRLPEPDRDAGPPLWRFRTVATVVEFISPTSPQDRIVFDTVCPEVFALFRP